MPLSKQSFTWPIQGGLDTKRAPLSVAPGSNLLVQDVREERLGEWRRRDGFSQADGNTLPEAAPYFVGGLGGLGLLELGQGGLRQYSPSVTPHWALYQFYSPLPQHRTRTPIVASAIATLGMARAGNLVVVSQFSAGYVTLKAFDVGSGNVVSATQVLGTSTFTGTPRGAATATKLVTVYLQDATVPGNDGVYVVVTDAVTGVSGAAVKIKAGTFASVDAMYFTGATITIVFATAAGAVRVIEYNPTTGAVAVDVAIGGLTASKVFLMADASAAASGVRFLGATFATPTTRVLRLDSAGAVLTNDQAEAVESSVITGVGATAGAEWYIVYRTVAGVLRAQSKVGGVVGAAGSLFPSSATIDSQAWSEGNSMHFLAGLHSTNVDDPQDTWVELLMPLNGGFGGSSAIPISVVASLAAGTVPLSHGIAQVVRTATYKFSTVLPVQVVYEDNAGVIVRNYSLDLFEQTMLTNADNAQNITSQPVPWRNSSLVPTGHLALFDAGALVQIGTQTPPPQLSLVASTGAGALSLLKQYGYIAVVEQIDSDGNLWRSPPSEPILLTLTGTQNTVTVTFTNWSIDPSQLYRLALYRTSGNTSLYRRIYSQVIGWGALATIVYVDLIADTAQGQGQALYSTGEIPNIITPPASMVTLALDRAWIVNREYPTELSYSKQLRPGRLPEFNDEMVHDLDDEFGGITAIVGVDDKLIAWKESAVYTASGLGLDDAGAGQGYTVTRIDSSMGAIVGSPVLGLGKEAYFVSKRGISRVRGDGECEFIGSPVDLYLNQPQLATRETVRAIVYSKKWNEVRFVTNASVLVYNRTFEIWSRWLGGLTTGSPLAHSLMVNDAQWIFREDGKVFVEGDTSQLTDGATAYSGYLRSPYMTPAQTEGRLRLYQARALAQRTAGGSPILPRLSVFFDYDDGTQIDFGPPSPVPNAAGSYLFAGKPNVKRQTCNSFAEQITFPAGDNTWRIERWGAVVGIKPGYSRNAQQWSEE